MRTSISRLLATTALGAPLALTGVVADAASSIGKVAAVNPSMDGTPPAASSRQLSLGAGVLQNERIETSAGGSGQLLFLDQTSLSIAPESDLVLDKYVYDPQQQTGEVALTLTKGVLRMIGGRITKRRDGIVRTPTATIGVRGGLALVIVDPSGQTRVCHVAGQYTKVNSDAGGELILSRANACAVIQPGQIATFDGLIKAEELSEIYREIEGNGNGGRAIAANTIDTANISGVNSGEKRGPNDQPVSTSGHSYAPEEGSRDEDRPRQDQTVQVVTIEVPVEDIFVQPEEPVVPPVIEFPETDPEFSPFLTGLGGGSVLNISGSGAAGTGFVEVLQGSLIGNGADFSELRVPVPDTDGISDAEFNTAAIKATIDQNGVEFTGAELAPGSGLFEFFLGDEEFDGNGDQIAGSFSSEIGDIRGVGFTDPGEQFTYVEFADDTPFETSTGFAVFGDATFGQSQFATGDAVITADPNFAGRFIATIDRSLLVPGLENGIANTVEGFAVQPNTFLHDIRDDSPIRGQTPFLMVGNQGFARYDRNDTTISTAEGIKGTDLIGGGKWLNGALHISTSSTGVQESDFMVFADDIRSFEGSGPIVSGTAFLTSFFEGFEEETGNEQLTFSAGTLNLGTLEDQDANAVFGEQNRFMVLSNLHRAGLESGSSIPPAFSNNAGAATGLIQIDGDTSADFTSNIYSEITETAGDYNALLVRDERLDEVIANPLPLAGARVETFYDDIDPVQVDVLDRGFAAGVAVCEGGQCGDIDNFRSSETGLAVEIVDFSGSYSVRTTTDDFEPFSLSFGGHDVLNTDLPDVDNEAVNFDTTNQVQATFTVTSNGVGEIPDANLEGFNLASYEISAGGVTSAFVDDNRFAAVGLNQTGTVSTAGGSDTITTSAALASSGLVGTGDLAFPTETELAPQFARWGWWSASLEVPIARSADPRTDIIHLGNWVAGVGFDFRTDEIPSSGIAGYSGLAVGTMTNLVSFDRQIVGGNFNMFFDFASQSGAFNLNIPAASLNENVTITGFGTDVFGGRNTNVATSTITDIDGVFFTNPTAASVSGGGVNDSIAAVGGTFEATDVANQIQTTGVFAGDRANFTPPTLLDSGTAATGPILGTGDAIVPGSVTAGVVSD